MRHPTAWGTGGGRLLPWLGAEKIRSAILDMPLVSSVFAVAVVAYVVGMLLMTVCDIQQIDVLKNVRGDWRDGDN